MIKYNQFKKIKCVITVFLCFLLSVSVFAEKYEDNVFEETVYEFDDIKDLMVFAEWSFSVGKAKRPEDIEENIEAALRKMEEGAAQDNLRKVFMKEMDAIAAVEGRRESDEEIIARFQKVMEILLGDVDARGSIDPQIYLRRVFLNVQEKLRKSDAHIMRKYHNKMMQIATRFIIGVNLVDPELDYSFDHLFLDRKPGDEIPRDLTENILKRPLFYGDITYERFKHDFDISNDLWREMLKTEDGRTLFASYWREWYFWYINTLEFLEDDFGGLNLLKIGVSALEKMDIFKTWPLYQKASLLLRMLHYGYDFSIFYRLKCSSDRLCCSLVLDAHFNALSREIVFDQEPDEFLAIEKSVLKRRPFQKRDLTVTALVKEASMRLGLDEKEVDFGHMHRVMNDWRSFFYTRF